MNPENTLKEDFISERSSNLDIEKLIIKRKNERFAYLLGMFTQILWAFNGVQIKTCRRYFPDSYSDNSVLFWRMFIVTLIGYIICKYKNVHIQKLSELKNLNWFLLRNITAYVFIMCWIKMFSYFRVSTISVVGSTAPLMIIILSVFLINEKFYLRYLIGVLLCIVSSAIIISNDKNPSSKSQILNDNVFVGIFFAICNISLYSLSAVAQKVLTKEGMEINLQNYYFGLYNSVPAFVMYIFSGEIFSINIKYCLYVCTNGLNFYIANYLTTICLKYIAVSKFQLISYLGIVFTFILSAILLGEPIFFTDIFGAGVIIGFQYYNFIHPPGRNVNENVSKEKFLNRENNS
jgi:drug/metabolite transporter (DMT)-like permease